MSRIRADQITNVDASGPPTATNGLVVNNGLVVSGVTSSTSFSGNFNSGNFNGGDVVGTSASISGITTTSNLVVENSAYTAITTTSINKTIVNREFCVTLGVGTAAGLTITLPATPQPGWLTGVGIGGTFTDTIVARNGSNIMNLGEDFTIDVANLNVSFLYIDNTYGWKVI